MTILTHQQSTPLSQIKWDFKRWLKSKHVIFVLAMLAYLCFESSFHAILTSTVIDPTSDIDDIHKVEIYGRLISGFGSGLLFTGALFGILPNIFKKNVLTKPLIFLLIFFLVYFGQKAVIETFLIEPSSAQVRRDAVLVNTVKTGLYNQDLVSQSLAFRDSVKDDVEQKVMLSLLSTGFLYNDEFKRNAMAQLSPILKAIATNAYNSVFYSDILPKYNESRHDVKNAFQEYGDAHRLRDKNLQTSVIANRWKQLYNDASREYIRADIKAQVEKAGYSLRNNRVRREYDKNVNRSLNEVARYANSNGKTSLTRGSSKRFIQQAKNRFSDVNRSIQKELNLPKGSLQLYPKNSAYPWLKHATIVEFENELDQQLSRHDIAGIAPNIRRFSTFERYKDIQKKAKDALGDYYVQGFSFNWNDAQLFNALKHNFVKTEVKRMKHNITGNISAFENGGELENIGKDALRAILIPCIALVLSVILSVTSIVKLISLAFCSFKMSFFRGAGWIITEYDQIVRAEKVFNTAQMAKNIWVWLLRICIIFSVIIIVIKMPSIIGWHDDIEPLLDPHSPILINFVNALTPLVKMLIITIDDLLLTSLAIFVIYELFTVINKTRLYKKSSIKLTKKYHSDAIKSLRFQHTITTALKIMIVFLPLIYLINQPIDIQSKNIASFSYRWLLSVQPLVYLQGQYLNEIASLPDIVNSVTGILKEFDSHFWPN